MMNSLGMPSLIECCYLEENLKLCQELNLDFVELNMNLFQYQPQNQDITTVKNLLQKYDKYLTIHLPEDMDVGHFNEVINDAYKTVFKQTVAFAKEVNSPIINMHMSLGIFFTLPDKKIYLYEQYNQEYMANIIAFRQLVENELGDSSIILTIENTGIYNVTFIQDAVDELLKSECIRLTYDIGHDYSSGNLDKDFILKRQDKLEHYHIHDGINKNNHLALYTGNIDLSKVFKLINNQPGRMVLETKTIQGLKKSVENLNRNKDENENSSRR